MELSRRRFLASCGAAGAASAWPQSGDVLAAASAGPRVYHVCMCPEGLEANPERLPLFAKCGVTDVWVGSFFYGHWPAPPERLAYWLEEIRKAGMNAHGVNIPLGHPGDSLGSANNTIALTPPKNWRDGIRPDGSAYSGTSLHPPATEQNRVALQTMSKMGIKRVFLDDDFRRAVSPGIVGGCFCADHRKEFLQSRGYPDAQWEALLADVKARQLSPLLRAWVEFTCDGLTTCFRSQQEAVPEIDLGIMVMFFGSEKAGIRLADYAGKLMRVGELMFDDKSFSTIKNKTAELYSVLFHRRFVTPERAYSETTAYPADKLSARNMAAKLPISTIADVRNTMFMSGATPFPSAHWDVLPAVMKKQAQHHEKLAGHALQGPFKHCWGEWSRYVGKDAPFSLFLAAGVPFEVTETPAKDGWTFLSNEDVQGLAVGAVPKNGTTFIARPEAPEGVRKVKEEFEDLFALKKELAPQWNNVPYVEEDIPVVCAWYPTARAVLLWNVGEEKASFTVRLGNTRRTVEVNGLDTELLEDIG